MSKELNQFEGIGLQSYTEFKQDQKFPSNWPKRITYRKRIRQENAILDPIKRGLKILKNKDIPKIPSINTSPLHDMDLPKIHPAISPRSPLLLQPLLKNHAPQLLETINDEKLTIHTPRLPSLSNAGALNRSPRSPLPYRNDKDIPNPGGLNIICDGSNGSIRHANRRRSPVEDIFDSREAQLNYNSPSDSSGNTTMESDTRVISLTRKISDLSTDLEGNDENELHDESGNSTEDPDNELQHHLEIYKLNGVDYEAIHHKMSQLELEQQSTLVAISASGKNQKLKNASYSCDSIPQCYPHPPSCSSPLKSQSNAHTPRPGSARYKYNGIRVVANEKEEQILAADVIMKASMMLLDQLDSNSDTIYSDGKFIESPSSDLKNLTINTSVEEAKTAPTSPLIVLPPNSLDVSTESPPATTVDKGVLAIHNLVSYDIKDTNASLTLTNDTTLSSSVSNILSATSCTDTLPSRSSTDTDTLPTVSVSNTLPVSSATSTTPASTDSNTLPASTVSSSIGIKIGSSSSSGPSTSLNSQPIEHHRRTSGLAMFTGILNGFSTGNAKIRQSNRDRIDSKSSSQNSLQENLVDESASSNISAPVVTSTVNYSIVPTHQPAKRRNSMNVFTDFMGNIGQSNNKPAPSKASLDSETGSLHSDQMVPLVSSMKNHKHVNILPPLVTQASYDEDAIVPPTTLDKNLSLSSHTSSLKSPYPTSGKGSITATTLSLKSPAAAPLKRANSLIKGMWNFFENTTSDKSKRKKVVTFAEKADIITPIPVYYYTAEELEEIENIRRNGNLGSQREWQWCNLNEIDDDDDEEEEEEKEKVVVIEEMNDNKRTDCEMMRLEDSTNTVAERNISIANQTDTMKKRQVEGGKDNELDILVEQEIDRKREKMKEDLLKSEVLKLWQQDQNRQTEGSSGQELLKQNSGCISATPFSSPAVSSPRHLSPTIPPSIGAKEPSTSPPSPPIIVSPPTDNTINSLSSVFTANTIDKKPVSHTSDASPTVSLRAAAATTNDSVDGIDVVKAPKTRPQSMWHKIHTAMKFVAVKKVDGRKKVMFKDTPEVIPKKYNFDYSIIVIDNEIANSSPLLASTDCFDEEDNEVLESSLIKALRRKSKLTTAKVSAVQCSLNMVQNGVNSDSNRIMNSTANSSGQIVDAQNHLGSFHSRIAAVPAYQSISPNSGLQITEGESVVVPIQTHYKYKEKWKQLAEVARAKESQGRTESQPQMLPMDHAYRRSATAPSYSSNNEATSSSTNLRKEYRYRAKWRHLYSKSITQKQISSNANGDFTHRQQRVRTRSRSASMKSFQESAIVEVLDAVEEGDEGGDDKVIEKRRPSPPLKCREKSFLSGGGGGGGGVHESDSPRKRKSINAYNHENTFRIVRPPSVHLKPQENKFEAAMKAARESVDASSLPALRQLQLSASLSEEPLTMYTKKRQMRRVLPRKHENMIDDARVHCLSTYRSGKAERRKLEERVRIFHSFGINGIERGFVTSDYVAKDVIKITVSFRGTMDIWDMMTDIQFAPSTLKESFNIEGHVHTGFLKRYLAHRDEVYDLVSKVGAQENVSPLTEVLIVFTGHSLGGALANLAALDYKHVLGFKNVFCVNFSAPKVFDKEGCDIYNKIMSHRSYRLIVYGDIIPKIMPNSWYVHVDKLVNYKPKKVKNKPQAFYAHMLTHYRRPTMAPPPPRMSFLAVVDQIMRSRHSRLGSKRSKAKSRSRAAVAAAAVAPNTRRTLRNSVNNNNNEIGYARVCL